MNKACSSSKTRVKHNEGGRKTRNSKGSDVNCDNAEVNSTAALPGNNTRAIVTESECGDVPEQPQCSQESFIEASQETGFSREVRWDYRSPETVKKLKKCRGQYSCEEVRKIVDVFNDTDVQSEDSLLHSVKLYLPSQDEASFSRFSNQSRPRERVVKKYKQRALTKDTVQHMLTVLKEQAEKPKKDCRKQLKRLSDGSTARVSEVSDGSDLTSAHVSEICDKSDLSSVCASETHFATTSSVLSQSCDNKDESFWSDEDLFKDNSFIIEATQNPEKFLGAAAQQRNLGDSEKTKKSAAGDGENLALLTAAQADASVCHKTLLADSFVIPSSCTSKPSSVLGVKPLVNVRSSSSSSSSTTATSYTFKNIQPSGIPGRIPTCLSQKNNNPRSTINTGQSFKTHGTATSKSYNLNTRCQDRQAFQNSQSSIQNSLSVQNSQLVQNSQSIQNSQSVIVNPPPEGKYKTSFRKFGSFSSSPTASQNDSGSSKKNGNSNISSSFRKTLSFDSSVSSRRPAAGLYKLSVPDFSNSLGKPKPSVSHNSRSEKHDVKPKLSEPVTVPNMRAVQDDGFDISLPEELFQKLLEDDEILDSQACAISAASAMNLLPVKTTSHCDAVSGIGLKTSLLSKPKLGTGTSNAALKSTFANSTASKIGSETSSGIGSETTSLSKLNLGSKTSNSKPNFTNTTASKKVVKENGKTAALKADKQQVTTSKPTGSLPSPVRPVAGLQNRHKFNKNSPVHTYYKKTFSLQQRGSPRRGKSEHSQLSLPSSSTPVKDSSHDRSDDVQASFLDSVFDDSFSNDQALFESQIVPLLEQVEAEAALTQHEPSILEPSVLEPSVLEPSVLEPSVVTKCSSKEIEQKRQAALQKRHLKLSQCNDTNKFK